MSRTPLYVAGMVLFGCLNTETTKMQFTLPSVGLDGVPKTFHKPWQAVFTMFLAMDVVLLYHFIGECCSRRKTVKIVDVDTSVPLVKGASPAVRPARGLKLFFIVAVPALFDLLGTGFGMIGFVYLPASINQMLRGSTIVFSAIMSVFFLGRKMMCYNWLGVCLCVLGISLVGASTILGSDVGRSSGAAASSGALFGMCMNLLGQVFAAGQVIVEEKLLKSLSVPPMLVVGYEGAWGTIIMATIVFPLLYALPGNDNGSVENIFDTVAMWRNNHALFEIIFIYLFSCSTYNIAGMLVTGALSAVHRMMLEASRTMFIWLVNLSVFYFINPSSGLGERWTPYSWIQLAGFIVVIFGQTVYGGLLKVPGLTYDLAKLPQPTPSPAGMYTNAMVSLPDNEHDAEDLCKL